MIVTTWNEHRLSKLMLGTAQFGRPYGVANRTGQPAYRDVVAIVAAALEGGVNCFDTAADYGTSEEVLGRALAELGAADDVLVVTKILPLTAEQWADSAAAARAIERSLSESRRRLNIDCLPLVLFHREADVVHRQVVERLQERGWLRHVGVSCDNRPGPAAEFVATGNVAALQLPANVLDRRHLRSGVFRQAAAKGVATFVRSVYLQGLLVMPEEDIPAALAEVVPVRRRLERIAGEAGMGLAELALRYILSQNGVNCVLTGVETVAQVRDNLAIFAHGPLPADMLNAIEDAVPELPETVLTPGLWPPRTTMTAEATIPVEGVARRRPRPFP